MRVLIFTNMYPCPAAPFYGSFVKDDAGALRKAGVEVDVYFVNGRANKLNYVGAPFGLMSRLRARRYDVIHVHHSFCAFFATMQKNIPVAWTFHEGEITSGEEVIRADRAVKRLAYSKGFKRWMARKVDAVVVVSDHLKEPLGRPDAETIPCGIDTGLFRPMDRAEAKAKLGLDPDRRYVLFPSSPERIEKRFDLALAGVKEYEELGGGALELLCLDKVPHGEVPVYMNACEAFLMTSVFEASPVTVREALSCNVPVLSTDVGDVRTVLDGIDGCYMIEADARDIAVKLQKALAPDVPFAGREKMADYSLESTAKKLVGLYERLIERKRRRWQSEQSER